MISRASLPAFLLLFLSCAASAQRGTSVLGTPQGYGPAAGLVESTMAERDLWTITSGDDRSPLESRGGSVSKLDLKAPGKARREYEKAYDFLMRKNLQGAVQHLTVATLIYPSFVAAHNALGSAYLSLGKNDQAQSEFSQAVALDDHLPSSFFNLGRAELALKHFPAALDSIQKASAIAPLDLQMVTALAYAQFLNHDYGATIATAHQVHDRKHKGAAVIHLYAAAAWSAQNNFPQALRELETMLQEDPKSPAKAQALQMMDHLKHPSTASEFKMSLTKNPSDAPDGAPQTPGNVQKWMQAARESAQIAEAAAEAVCPTCETTESPVPAETAVARPLPTPNIPVTQPSGFTFHASADEVAVFFAATDHGRSVTDLTGGDIGIRDDRNPPAAVTGFRNESQLPLQLGLVIDTSTSITDSFKFEQDAATNFMQRVMTGKNDLAFVIGFASSVLLVQNFTGNQKLISHAVGQLAPSGGTALWDAVAFAADKLANRQEDQPVARLLVVISDGNDNSSSATLKDVISRLQHEQVVVYAVSTRETTDKGVDSLVGERALKTLAQLTGGAAFAPESARSLNGSLVDLQQVIRSRYLVSYKPALFKRDGQYRAIDITAEKNGRKLRVYARKGYFAAATPN